MIARPGRRLCCLGVVATTPSTRMWGSSSRANDVTNCCSWASVASSSATIARAHARPSAATLGSYTLRADASNVSAVSPCRNSVRTARSASSSGRTPSLAAPAAMALAACPCRNPRTRPMSEGTRDTAAVINPAIGAARSGCAAETTAPPAARTPSMSASAAEDPVPSLFVTSAQSGSPARAPATGPIARVIARADIDSVGTESGSSKSPGCSALKCPYGKPMTELLRQGGHPPCPLHLPCVPIPGLLRRPASHRPPVRREFRGINIARPDSLFVGTVDDVLAESRDREGEETVIRCMDEPLPDQRVPSRRHRGEISTKRSRHIT